MPSPRSVPNLRLTWDGFTLEPDSGVVDAPTDEDVRAIVRHLGQSDDGFVVLSALPDEEEFVQTTLREPGEPEAGLIVEWRGPDGPLLSLDEGFIDAARACAIFAVFYQNRTRMDAAGAWHAVDDDADRMQTPE